MISFILQKSKNYYLNGNYLVFRNYDEKLYKRCLRIGEDLEANFPDSIDLKITNKCGYNCPYCHENSLPSGSSFNFDHTIEILKQLPKVPIEIAIGGGNVLEIPSDTLKLIRWCNEYGFKTRITINHKDVKKFIIPTLKSTSFSSKLKNDDNNPTTKNIIRDIGLSVGGVGISLDPSLLADSDNKPITTDLGTYNILYDKIYEEFDTSKYSLSNTLRGKYIVFHIIAGLFPIDKLKMLLSKYCINSVRHLLILGYKQFGRAANTDLPESLPEFEKVIKDCILNARNDYTVKFNIAFDNLALEQLHMKDFIKQDEWDYLYLGEEGSCSMYIDAVNEVYARSSTSNERTSWKEVGLLDYFKSLRK